MSYVEKVKRLKEMSQRYYGGNPIATDDEFDNLRRATLELEKSMDKDEIDPLSPTQAVGARIDGGFAKKKHLKKKLSIEDFFSDEELLEWASKHPVGTTYFIEPKFDGASLFATYKEGNLVSLVTRGDGEEGEDITLNAPYIDIPLLIAHKGFVEVGGETVILSEDFRSVNSFRISNGKSAFLNQRNGASGAIRSLENVRNYKLRFIPYSLGENDKDFSTQQEEAQWFSTQGFKDYDAHKFSISGTIEEVIEAFHSIEKDREKYRMLLDGAVIKVSEKHLQEELGETNHHPRYMAARKFQAQEKTATLLGVAVQVGKLGNLTPVAEISPTEIGGVTIRRVTLHNYKEIKRLGLKIGDSVIVVRSGDVIPKITKVFAERRNGSEKDIVEPTSCPNCGCETLDKEQVAIRCTNEECSSKIKGRIAYAAGRKALKMEALGEATIDEMVDVGLVKNLVDLFGLSMSDLLTLKGFKAKKAENVYNAIQSAVGSDMERVLNALDVPQIGQTSSRKIAEAFGERTLDMLSSPISYEELIAVPDIGDEGAKNFVSFMQKHKDFVKELVEIVKPVVEEKVVAGDNLNGKTFVITGTLSRPRGEFKALVEAHGGKVSGSVSKNTSFVLAGEAAGSKAVKAEKLGVLILTEGEFFALIS